MVWTLDDSKLVYGTGDQDLYFLKISDEGKLLLDFDISEWEIEDIITEIIEKYPELQNRSSFTLRIPQLIDNQIKRIFHTFEHEMEKQGYRGDFYPLYPIKVNQNRQVIEAILDASKNYGLEAGTKSELILVLDALENDKNRLIMCNGVKDIEYVNIIVEALKSGYNIALSIESPSELDRIYNRFGNEDLKLYLRIKPYVSMYDYGASSAGRNSKFGLSIDNLTITLTKLDKYNMGRNLIGIHAHPGSQVANLYEFTQYFRYVVKIYSDIRKKGFNQLTKINFGGGLPINYDGRLPKKSIEKYCNLLIKTIIDQLNISILPDILIESGRYITAPSAMLVIQPLERQDIFPPMERNDNPDFQRLKDEISQIETINDILTLWQRWQTSAENIPFDEIRQREQLVGWLKSELRRKFFLLPFTHDHLKSPLVRNLISSDTMILGNFSVFNGVCDSVLTNQYFPVLPLRDLNIQPETIIRLVDITCDNDGEISIYRTKDSDLELFTKDGYPLTAKDPLEWNGFPIGSLNQILDTHLIIPLIGAYQDIVEFDHNLLGNLPNVELEMKQGKINVELVSRAKSIAELLGDVGFRVGNIETPYIYHPRGK